jgi:hypothetical protein
VAYSGHKELISSCSVRCVWSSAELIPGLTELRSSKRKRNYASKEQNYRPIASSAFRRRLSRGSASFATIKVPNKDGACCAPIIRLSDYAISRDCSRVVINTCPLNCGATEVTVAIASCVVSLHSVHAQPMIPASPKWIGSTWAQNYLALDPKDPTREWGSGVDWAMSCKSLNSVLSSFLVASHLSHGFIGIVMPFARLGRFSLLAALARLLFTLRRTPELKSRHMNCLHVPLNGQTCLTSGCFF